MATHHLRLANCLRLAIWCATLGFAAFWVYRSVDYVLATDWAAAAIAVAFIVPALLARPFYVGRSPTYAWQIDFRLALRRYRTQYPRVKSDWRFWIIERVRKPSRPWFCDWNWLRLAYAVCALLVVGGVCAAVEGKKFLLKKVEPLLASAELDPPIATIVTAADGEEICNFSNDDRQVVPLDHIPSHVLMAIVAAEDKKFFGDRRAIDRVDGEVLKRREHSASHGLIDSLSTFFDSHHRGIDLIAIFRAGNANVATGKVRQGGSTLTQQVIKQSVLKDRSKTKLRKLYEAALAPELEKQLGKERILWLYVSKGFFGKGAYGIRAAARTYFGKEPKHLTLSEAAFIAALPKAPSENSPTRDYQRAKNRRAYVLRRMRDIGAITAKQEQEALREEAVLIHLRDPKTRMADALTAGSVPYFCEHVKKHLLRHYGKEVVFGKGLHVSTTLNMKMQRAADGAVVNGLRRLEANIGFTGPEARVAVPTCSGDSPEPVQDDVYARVCVESERVSPHAIDTATSTQLPADAKRPQRTCWGGGVVIENEDVAVQKMRIVKGKPPVPVTVIEKSLVMCAGGSPFAMAPEDAARVVTWERQNGRRAEPGDVISVRIESRVATEGPKKVQKAVRYATLAPRTGAKVGDLWPLQAAMIIFDLKDGTVPAMVGGFDYATSQFNMATMSRQQIGSSMKPYVAAAAIERGVTVEDVIMDTQRCYSTSSGTWCPKNYFGRNTGRAFLGAVPVDTAMAKSLNSVFIMLAAKIGIRNVFRTMRAMGVTSKMVEVLPAAIGTPELTPIEHTAAISTIAVGGRRLPNHGPADGPGIYVRKVTDRRGQVLYEYRPKPKSDWVFGIRADVADTVRYMMEAVTDRGTGRRLKELGRPIAAKTGTSNKEKALWIVGFTADISFGLWVGREYPQQVAEEATGGSVAVPIVLSFLKQAHPDTPVRKFENSDDTALMLRKDGKPVPFIRGKMPARFFHDGPEQQLRSSVPRRVN